MSNDVLNPFYSFEATQLLTVEEKLGNYWELIDKAHCKADPFGIASGGVARALRGSLRDREK